MGDIMENIIVFLKRLVRLFRQGVPCLFYCATGIYCPGCGGSRAIKYLVKGEILKSLWYHPLVGYLAIVIGIEIGRTILGHSKMKRISRNCQKTPQNYHMEVYVGIAIILINWTVKNWALLAWGVNLIP